MKMEEIKKELATMYIANDHLHLSFVTKKTDHLHLDYHFIIIFTALCFINFMF